MADYFSNRPKRASLGFYEDRLRAEIENSSDSKVVLIGHSMGGVISLLVNQQLADRVAGIVLLCSAPPRHIPVYTWNMTWRMRKYVTDFIFGRDFAPRYEDARYLMFNDVAEEEAIELWRGVTTIPATIASAMYLGVNVVRPRNTQSVLCVVATEDNFVRADKGRALADWLGVTPMVVGGGHSLFTGPACSTVCAGVMGWMNDLRFR